MEEEVHILRSEHAHASSKPLLEMPSTQLTGVRNTLCILYPFLVHLKKKKKDKKKNAKQTKCSVVPELESH